MIASTKPTTVVGFGSFGGNSCVRSHSQTPRLGSRWLLGVAMCSLGDLILKAVTNLRRMRGLKKQPPTDLYPKKRTLSCPLFLGAF